MVGVGVQGMELDPECLILHLDGACSTLNYLSCGQDGKSNINTGMVHVHGIIWCMAWHGW